MVADNKWITKKLKFFSLSFFLVQHSINVLMITCRAPMLLCRACVGSNLIYTGYTAKYIQEIKFQKLFPFFLLLYTIHFRLKLYTSVVLKCCLRTDIWICSLKLSSVVHCTAATGRRFHCAIVL